MDPIHPLANVFDTGVRTGVLRILKGLSRKVSSKPSTNWLPRSRTRARASWSLWRMQVAGSLGGRSAGRVGGHTGVEHLSGLDVDEGVLAARIGRERR